ncbi:MAG: hypothetical protein VX798_05575 [Bacteroidota bacterium]|uniref:Outer membrane protein beta-barrel domain-containing protein n=1 Tax=Flagellimonas profundi TaxID=2915620 RepID=A0ABS3FG53_9FLAO|nr:hypothetical protein [Allomuricauda profundi]MBO0341902.1 hypothetical protein [Allomuricauda profundi]MEC7770633.1 hypothetical protein [Bacteroidota bacterium]
MKFAKLLILSVAPFFITAQEITDNDKNILQFIIGTEYRITPIYNSSISSLSENSTFTNMDAQNSGIALNLGLEYGITRNLSVGFSNSFRYDMVIAPRPEGNNGINVGTADYKIIVDYHLYLAYYFKVFPKGDIFVSAGMSLLNTNTDFSVKKIDEYGEGFYISDFSFFANRISIGFQSSKSRIYLGMNLSRTTDYFEETTSFIIPHIGFSYNLARL